MSKEKLIQSIRSVSATNPVTNIQLSSIIREIRNDKHYRHLQASPSRVWEIAHNLNKNPSISITDFEGNQYEAEVRQLDQNNTLLTFSVAFAGFADLN